MINDCNINKLAKNQVSAVFNSRAIRRSVTQIHRDLYGDAMLVNIRMGGNQQKHLLLSFATKA